jgi:membrane-associated phospholipid phosphatase
MIGSQLKEPPSPVDNGSVPTDPSPAERSLLMGMVDVADVKVDAWFEPLRGKPIPDGAAKLITGLGDHGLMWAATTVWRARRTGPSRTRAIKALAIAGVESNLANAGLKAVIGRSRPDPTGLRLVEGWVPVREPKTSSFPSGHTLAAFCAATVMSERGNRTGNALLFSSATLVGLSRLYLRAHHASDVVGGAMIGVALGSIGRKLL